MMRPFISFNVYNFIVQVMTYIQCCFENRTITYFCFVYVASPCFATIRQRRKHACIHLVKLYMQWRVTVCIVQLKFVYLVETFERFVSSGGKNVLGAPRTTQLIGPLEKYTVEGLRVGYNPQKSNYYFSSFSFLPIYWSKNQEFFSGAPGIILKNCQLTLFTR